MTSVATTVIRALLNIVRPKLEASVEDGMPASLLVAEVPVPPTRVEYAAPVGWAGSQPDVWTSGRGVRLVTKPTRIGSSDQSTIAVTATRLKTRAPRESLIPSPS